MKKLITISITGRCNRSCSYCVAGCPSSAQKQTGTMDAPMNADKSWVIDLIERDEFQLIALTGGEPLLHPNLKEIVNSTDKKIIIYTNGDLIKYNSYLLEMENVYFVLGAHMKYRTLEGFNNLKKLFPEKRTLINIVIDSDQDKKDAFFYGHGYTCIHSGNVRGINTARYSKAPFEIENSDRLYALNNSKTANPDGFLFDGVCDRVFNSFIADTSKAHKDTIEKLNSPYFSMFPMDLMARDIKEKCLNHCQAIWINAILFKFISITTTKELNNDSTI